MYFNVGACAYPLGTSRKFLKNEITYQEKKGTTPKLFFCEVGGNRQELSKKDFLDTVKQYENQ